MESGDNKSLFSVLLIGVLFLSVISFVSSNSAGASTGGVVTFVTGKIYYANTDQPVKKADVIVTCNHNNGVKITKKTTKSEGNGLYHVIFNQRLECDENDVVTVKASKDGVSGSNDGKVHDRVIGAIDVAIVNVPLVPEFGTVVGILTAFGAVGVFFIVRRK
jgi:hypothetical protein